MILLLFLACAPDPDAAFCADLAADDAACMDEEAIAACEAANAECPGDVSVMESCPLQFGCP